MPSFESPSSEPVNPEEQLQAAVEKFENAGRTFQAIREKRLLESLTGIISDEQLYAPCTEEDISQGVPHPESLPSIEEVREKVAVELEEMLSYLVTTEEDESDAGAYYGELFSTNIEGVRKAETLSQLAAAVEDIFPDKIKMINSRFFDVKTGGVKKLFQLKYQSKKSVIPPFEHPAVQNVFYQLLPKINTYALIEKALSE